MYGILNNRTEVGRYEMIQTFKNWPYLQHETKVMIIDYIFDEFELPEDMYPYQKVKNYKKSSKIISFPGTNK